MHVVILAGGRGTQLAEETQMRPIPGVCEYAQDIESILERHPLESASTSGTAPWQNWT
jgi:hypothetical protein